MSFLDDLKDFFVTGDTFYPDNKKREVRAAFLRQECNTLAAKCLEQLKDQNIIMNEINEYIYKNYEKNTRLFIEGKAAFLDLPFKEAPNVFRAVSEVPFIHAVWSVIADVEPASKEEVLLKAIGKQCNMDDLFLTFLIVGAPVFGIIMGPINGSLRRDNLRSAIQNCRSARFETQKIYYINQEVFRLMKGIQQALQALNMLHMKDKEAVIDNIIHQIHVFTSEMKNEAKIHEVITNILRDQDQRNSQWTNEDSLVS